MESEVLVFLKDYSVLMILLWSLRFCSFQSWSKLQQKQNNVLQRLPIGIGHALDMCMCLDYVIKSCNSNSSGLC